jgi:hypothetical protein
MFPAAAAAAGILHTLLWAQSIKPTMKAIVIRDGKAGLADCVRCVAASLRSE